MKRTVLFVISLITAAIVMAASMALSDEMPKPDETKKSADIRIQNYAYRYEMAASMLEGAFVICETCPKRKAPLKLQLLPIRSIATNKPVVDGMKPAVDGNNLPIKGKTVTIYFDKGKYLPKDNDKAGLQRILPGMKVVVEGCASNEGTEEYNVRLSGKRAQWTADFLKAKGVKVVEVIGRGVCTLKPEEVNRNVKVTEVP